jgi:hypothetical protein
MVLSPIPQTQPLLRATGKWELGNRARVLAPTPVGPPIWVEPSTASSPASFRGTRLVPEMLELLCSATETNRRQEHL